MEIDNELIKACIRRDEKAMRKMYELLHEPLLRVCVRYYRNKEDAMFIMHEGVLKIFSKLKKYTYKRSFLNWCCTLMVNTILDDIRKSKRRKSVESYDFNIEARHQVLKSVNEDDENGEFIDSVLSYLPPATRVVFNLYVFEEFSHKEIAKAIKISEGTSKWHLSNARKILKEKIDVKKKGRNNILIYK